MWVCCVVSGERERVESKLMVEVRRARVSIPGVEDDEYCAIEDDSAEHRLSLVSSRSLSLSLSQQLLSSTFLPPHSITFHSLTHSRPPTNNQLAHATPTPSQRHLASTSTSLRNLQLGILLLLGLTRLSSHFGQLNTSFKTQILLVKSLLLPGLGLRVRFHCCSLATHEEDDSVSEWGDESSCC